MIQTYKDIWLKIFSTEFLLYITPMFEPKVGVGEPVLLTLFVVVPEEDWEKELREELGEELGEYEVVGGAGKDNEKWEEEIQNMIDDEDSADLR